jgi:hypothetical protein
MDLPTIATVSRLAGGGFDKPLVGLWITAVENPAERR